MALLPNFEYDIFISYRHNDNRSGWVTDFVNALQEELAATIKEPLSIYFDKNPHDGLLETHDVDDSLKDKLKCLIFIPIISRTYCDAKSFAWQHEFTAFLKIAAADSIGLKVKLSNGNTASRVLPIRIHELDANDKKTIETELQGVLRSIDFTYKAAGVNRPLLPKDDETIKGSGKATYRDQINKTANAISDIIAGMQGNTAAPAQSIQANEDEPVSTPRISSPKKNWILKLPEWSKVNGYKLATVVLSIFLLGLSFLYFSQTRPDNRTYRATLLPPANNTFSSFVGGDMALSPDGKTLAFVASDSIGKPRLWVRPLNVLEARPLDGTDDAYFPFWSPDNRFIGFFSEKKLKKIDISGGLPQILCDAPNARGGTWSKEGMIVFAGNVLDVPLSLVPASGGKVVSITKLDTARKETTHRWPCFLPDGRHFLYTSRIGTVANEEDVIFLASLDTTVVPKKILQASSNMAYANGHILFARQETVMAVPFDEEKLQAAGDAFPLVGSVNYAVTNLHTSVHLHRTKHTH